MSALTIWTVFLAPVAGFLVISLIIRPFFGKHQWISPFVLIAALLVSLIIAVMLFIDALATGGAGYNSAYEWIKINESAIIDLGTYIDPVSASTLVVVVLVSLLVQVYSMGYMHGDPGYSRYFATMALFTASMIGLVISSNILQLYAFWELVGLSSYLLIGFWTERPSAAAAAKKAFIITRIGDVGFLIGILFLINHSFSMDSVAGINVLHIPDICSIGGTMSGVIVTVITLGILSGAMGKSAQFPFHTWLPDAMEGPTPVSALVHSATMVAAGVFLLIRLFPFISDSGTTMLVIAGVGAFTAVFAATMGLVVHDIKRVLAYSSISQLAYMFAAIGLGAYGPAIFHLITHAFFKALLFLCSGSVNHATHTFDMREMGGLRKSMPWTYGLMMISSLSLIGLPPLAGFWSKDEIMLSAWDLLLHGAIFELIIFGLLAIGVILTAFYTWRMISLTFHGTYRGDSHSIHESPTIMIAPMFVLGILTVIAGVLTNPPINLGSLHKHWLGDFISSSTVFHHGHHVAEFSVMIATISTMLGLLGILAGIYYFKKSKQGIEEPLESLKSVHTLVYNKYYLDTLYEDIIVKNFLQKRIVNITALFDKYIVDGLGITIGFMVRNVGHILGLIQNGNVQFYTFIISLGGVIGLILLLMYAPGIGG